LSFKADLTDLAPLSNYDVFYGVGITTSTNEILDWTPLSDPQSLNQLDLTIGEIPENYEVFINLKAVTKDTSTETFYSSSALKGK
jgi:hypothetical protein